MPDADAETPSHEPAEVVYDKLGRRRGDHRRDAATTEEEKPEELIDESNPFYKKKKAATAPKAVSKDSKTLPRRTS